MKLVGIAISLVAVLTMTIPIYANSDDDEYYYSDGSGHDWTDFDGNGQFTEYDVDRMCDENYVDEDEKDEKACKAMYEEIEAIYGYETEENEHEDEDDRE
jgi:hypothetical protein